MSGAIYRIQDKDGRGPYKPGFSKHWSDPDARCLIKAPLFATYMDEFPEVLNKIGKHFMAYGGHFGCGFRTTQQLHIWFTDEELQKLKQYDYRVVIIIPDAVLAESENQLVFWCKKPFNKSIQSLLPLPKDHETGESK